MKYKRNFQTGGSLKGKAGSGGGGFSITKFKDLSDCPHSYTGQGSKVLAVNVAETGIEFLLGRGVSNGFASLDGSGKLPTSQLPPLAISDFLGTAGSQPAMLLLLGQVGDWCIRSDLGTVFIITSGDGHLIGDWTQLSYPLPLTDNISLINDYLGNIRTSSRPVKSFFSPAGGLPVLPTVGDRYISSATASGWTIHHIYEWSGAVWTDFAPYEGMSLVNKLDGFMYSFVTLSGGLAWYQFPAVDGSTLDISDFTIFVKNLAITDAKVAVANKDGTAATPSMRTLGAGALQACAGNDARLSDARTPTAHALAGAQHSSDTITNVNTKLSDGSLITSKAAEISALTAKGTPTTSDLLMIEDTADTNKKKKITIANLPAATPASHALAGAQHSSDTITNVNTKLSDGSLITSKAAEISALTSKSLPTTSDLIMIEDAAAANAKKKITVPDLYAHGFLYPNLATGTITTYVTSTGGANLLYYRGLYWSAVNQVAAWQILIPTPYNPLVSGELILRFILKGINLGGANRTYTFGLGAMAIGNNVDISAYSMVYADTFSLPVLIAEEQNWFQVERTITIANSPAAGKALIIQLRRTDAVTGQPECMGVWWRMRTG